MAYQGFGDYMETRRQKQQHQYIEHQQEWSSPTLDQDSVLRQCVFYLDGVLEQQVEPGLPSIRSAIINMGGLIVDYYSARVTHILCTQLTLSKAENWQKSSTRQPIIIKPEWIYACLKEKRKVSWHPYRLFNNEMVGGQRSIKETLFERSSPSKKRPVSDCTDPDFVSSFFESSRLHHLSRWKTELKEFVEQELHNAMPITEQPILSLKTIHPKQIPYKILYHVDMDCFFASVAIRDRPHLVDKPVAISHSTLETHPAQESNSHYSTADIASCNYVARSFGIKNGMVIGKAKLLCPHLVIVPYEFDKYHQASLSLYRVLLSYSKKIQVVSCDEAFVDMSDGLSRIANKEDLDDAQHQKEAVDLAQRIRDDIFKSTGCCASVGISHNILLTRMATKKAKPNGIFYLAPQDIDSFLLQNPVEELPGIGWSLKQKLHDLNVRTVQDLRLQFKKLEELQSIFGKKTGQTLYQFARGIDDRPLVYVGQEGLSEDNMHRQSISAEVNWGVRFKKPDDVQDFLKSLSLELEKRMRTNGEKNMGSPSATKRILLGKQLTLKIKRRKEEAEPSKYLGHGFCDNLSKCVQLEFPTNDASIILEHAIRLLHAMKLAPVTIRGMGLQMSKLSYQGSGQDQSSPSRGKKMNQRSLRTMLLQGSTSSAQVSPLPDHSRDYYPSASQLDMSVVNDLPTQIRQEVEGFIVRDRKGKGIARETTTNKRTRSPSLHEPITASQIDPQVLKELPESIQQEIQANVIQQKSESHQTPRVKRVKVDFFSPKSHQQDAKNLYEDLTFSQLDPTVLQQLPGSIREEIEGALKTARDKEKCHENEEPSVHEEEPFDGILASYHIQQEFDQVLQQIQLWVMDACSDGCFVYSPLDEDVDYIKSYLSKLIRDKFVYEACMVLKHLNYRLVGTGPVVQSWRQMANELVGFLDHLVYTHFSVHLKLSLLV